MTDKKSVLEEALLEAQQLEEAVKSNAKEILASTMKQEIEELVKQSLNEQDDIDDEEVVDDVEEFDMLGDEENEDQEEEEVSVAILPDETEAMVSAIVDTDEPIDLTYASDEEVLKVFKSMGAEDGIVVTQDGDTIDLEDQDTGTEYKIELAENKLKRNPFIKEGFNSDDDMDEMYDDDMDESFVDAEEDMNEDETLYEIVLDDDMDIEDSETSIEDVELPEMYGGKRGDESKSRRDYETNEASRTHGMGSKKGRGLRKAISNNRNLSLNENAQVQKCVASTGIPTCLTNVVKGQVANVQGFINEVIALYAVNILTGGPSVNEITALMKRHSIEDTTKFLKGIQSCMSGKGMTGCIPKMNESRTSKNKSINEIIRISKQLQKENHSYREKNVEYRKALKLFRNKLNEIAVFNANLAYSTKLFTENTTTKKEKINVLRRFDNVKSLNESKTLFKQITSELNTKVSTLNEAVQKTITKAPSGGSSINLIETKTYENPQITRMKDIMSKL